MSATLFAAIPSAVALVMFILFVMAARECQARGRERDEAQQEAERRIFWPWHDGTTCIHGQPFGDGPHPSCNECEFSPYTNDADVKKSLTELDTWIPSGNPPLGNMRRELAAEIAWRRRLQRIIAQVREEGLSAKKIRAILQHEDPNYAEDA